MKHLLVVLFLAVTATTVARAGTTGIVTGTITDIQGAPVAEVLVKAISPSDREETTSDQKGHFAFLRLAPDSYVISMEKSGYAPVSYAGVAVFADNTLSLKFKLPKQLILITGRLRRYQDIKNVVVDGPHNSLVKERITSDLYNIYPGAFTEGLNSTPFLLQLIPGITVGTGGPIPH